MGGRKKREAVDRQKRDVMIPTNKVVYDIDLGQEILISNTPLSKEIYVETGTKVDSIQESGSNKFAGRDSKAVFILGDDKESELVCTTLPVVITAGAAVVFLQLCILTTCLLCLWSGRRHSGSESLHSGQTSTGTISPHPTLHTLYHDQLTYRPAAPSVTNSRITEHSANTLKSLRTKLRD